MIPDALQPQLEHNRAAEARLVRLKRKMLVAFLIASPVVVLLVPQRIAAGTWVVLLCCFGAGVAYVDIRRARLFQRDLRERRSEPPPGATDA